jgi:hypothetical protein
MEPQPTRPKKSQSSWKLDDGQTIIDRYDANADGIVDNDEFISGINGDDPGRGWDEEWDKKWSSMQVFNALEADTRSIVPDAVPGACADIMEYAVNPNEPWKKVWNSVVLGAVIVSTFEVPFTSAFQPDSKESPFEYLIDLIFYADIVLSFFTGVLFGTAPGATLLCRLCTAALTLFPVRGALRF